MLGQADPFGRHSSELGEVSARSGFQTLDSTSGAECPRRHRPGMLQAVSAAESGRVLLVLFTVGVHLRQLDVLEEAERVLLYFESFGSRSFLAACVLGHDRPAKQSISFSKGFHQRLVREQTRSVLRILLLIAALESRGNFFELFASGCQVRDD